MTTETDTESSWMGPRNEVLDRLQLELESDRETAESLARELTPLHPSLRAEFLAWLKSEKVDLDREIHGWSLRKLIDEGHSTHVSQAFTWMNGLVIHPEQTQKLLNKPNCVIVGSRPGG